MMAAQQGPCEEAIQNFRQSLLLRPAYATALLNLGNVYRRRRLREGAESLKHALEIQPMIPRRTTAWNVLRQQTSCRTPAGFLQKA